MDECGAQFLFDVIIEGDLKGRIILAGYRAYPYQETGGEQKW
jgi:hypothetical protein